MFYLGDTLVTADKTPVFFYVPNINQTTTMEKSVILISLIVASAIALMACPRPQSRGGDRGGKVAQGIRVAGKTVDKLRPHDV